MNKIHPTAILENVVIMGDNITIGPYSTIGQPPEQRGYSGTRFPVELHSNVIIREHVTIHCGVTRNTIIGEDSWIMSHSHIGHDAIIGKHVNVAGATVGGHGEVGDYCFLSIKAVMHPWAILKRLSIIGASSFYKGRFPLEGMKFAGVPCRLLGVNEIGIQRAFPESAAEKLIDKLWSKIAPDGKGGYFVI